MTLIPAARDMLVRATQLLAAEPAVQVATFPQFVVVADELALNFSASFELVDQLGDAALLTQDQVTRLAELESALIELTLSGDEGLWTVEALRDRPEWALVRSRANVALAALGGAAGPPSTAGITYIRGGTT
jgi:hypothetical protein